MRCKVVIVLPALAACVFNAPSDRGSTGGSISTENFLSQTQRRPNITHSRRPTLASASAPRASKSSTADSIVQAAEDGRVSASLYQQVLGGLLRIPERVYNHIAVDAQYDNLYEEILTFPERRPRLFNVMLATVKTWGADFVVQMSEKAQAFSQSGAWQFDRRRSAAFAIFGFIYVGMVQWIIYISLFTFFCPHAIEFANEPMTLKYNDHSGQTDLLKQVFLDNFVVDSFVYFPLFYVIKESIRVGFHNFRLSTISDAITRYIGNFKADNFAAWSIWVPTDFLIFSAPMWARMPLDHLVSFGWTMILSHMRGASTEKSVK